MCSDLALQEWGWKIKLYYDYIKMLISFIFYLAQRRPVAAVRPFLLRRGTTGAPTGGSFKRRSLKLRRGTKDGKDIEADCK